MPTAYQASVEASFESLAPVGGSLSTPALLLRRSTARGSRRSRLSGQASLEQLLDDRHAVERQVSLAAAKVAAAARIAMDAAESVPPVAPTPLRSRRPRSADASNSRVARAVREARAAGSIVEGCTLSESMPLWYVPSPAAAAAVERFDRRHLALTSRAATALVVAGLNGGTAEHRLELFEMAVSDVRFNKFFIPENAPRAGQRLQTRAPNQRPLTAPAPKSVWRLETSAWANRRRYCDAHSFYDTPEVMRRAFETDWTAAVEANRCALVKFVVRHDDDGEHDGDGDGVFDEVAETKEALWRAHKLLYAMFDFYASLGEKDCYSITQNAYTLWVTDCCLESRSSRFCTNKHLDQLFVQVNAGASEEFNTKNSLSRQEFLQVVVRVAVAKYVMTGELADVSDAIERLVRDDLSRAVTVLPEFLTQDSNLFRRRFCYHEAVDVALRRHEASLRALYNRYATGGAAGGGEQLQRRGNAKEVEKMSSTSLLGLDEWSKLVTDLRLVDAGFSPRLVTLTYVWCRMRVVDEMKSRVKLTNLHFEDFLEAIVRCATTKPWPSADEVRAAGCLDAGHFVLELQADSQQLYSQWVDDRKRPWLVGGATGALPTAAQQAAYSGEALTSLDKAAEELAAAGSAGDSRGGSGGGGNDDDDDDGGDPERVAECVRNLLTLVVRTVDASTLSKGAHDQRISDVEADGFYQDGPLAPDMLVGAIDKKLAAGAKKAGKPVPRRTATAPSLVRAQQRQAQAEDAAPVVTYEHSSSSEAFALS